MQPCVNDDQIPHHEQHIKWTTAQEWNLSAPQCRKKDGILSETHHVLLGFVDIFLSGRLEPILTEDLEFLQSVREDASVLPSDRALAGYTLGV